MSGQAQTVLRWGACLAFVLGLHVAAASMLLRRDPRPEPPLLAPDAVMLELAPDATVPAPEQAPPPQVADPLPPAPDPPQPSPDPEPPPTPPQPEPEPEPAPPAVPPAVPVPDPAVILPEPPPPPPPPPKRPPPPRPAARPPPRPAQASPPQPAPEAPAPSVAAPAPALPAAAPSSAVPGWRSELAGRLQRAKRYPDAARARDEQGAAAVRFTIDRGGHVLSVSLIRSSGSAALDEEAVALVRRADPLPPVPAELAGSTLTLTVPVSFSLR